MGHSQGRSGPEMHRAGGDDRPPRPLLRERRYEVRLKDCPVF
jgi:hypothetical protein